MNAHVLSVVTFPAGARLAQPQTDVRPTSRHAPAIEVMTDFLRVPPVTAQPEELVSEAEARMIRRGVRSVLVTHVNDELVGILTATDILGEKLVQVARDRGISAREVRVADLMTPASTMDALRLDEVMRATVADVIATLQHLGRQHALVVDSASDTPVVRGIFSSTQIARQLGEELPVHVKARTFAEIEAALK